MFVLMNLRELTHHLDQMIPLQRAEDFDNVGWLCGDMEMEVSGILVCHDTLPEVVEEAIDKNCNVIFSFHPIWFSSKKKLVSGNYVDDALLKAIKNDIAIYAVHTAWDKHPNGVSYALAKRLGLEQIEPLEPHWKPLAQIMVYVPKDFQEIIRKTLAEAGAGKIGEYDACSFSWEGEGRFRPLEDAKPFSGNIGEIHTEKEIAITAVCKKNDAQTIIEKVRAVHPYEEMAYQIYLLENSIFDGGLGAVGMFAEPLAEKDFLTKVKDRLGIEMLRYTRGGSQVIKRVGVLGGSGADMLETAIRKGCDAYICGDLKYHDFMKAQNKILLIDAGHYETEKWVVEDLHHILTENLRTFAVLKSQHYTNPVKYFL